MTTNTTSNSNHGAWGGAWGASATTQPPAAPPAPHLSPDQQLYGNTGFNVIKSDKGYAASLHPLVQQSLSAMEQAYPGYLTGLTNSINQLSTPWGQQGLIDSQRNQFNANAMDQGRSMANLTAYQGGGYADQQAAMMAARQNGYAQGNQAQNAYGTPQGQLQAAQAAQQMMAALGANSPVWGMMQSLTTPIMQARGINASQPESPGILGSLLGAAAGVAPLIKF